MARTKAGELERVTVSFEPSALRTKAGELSEADYDTLAYACDRIIVIKKMEGEDDDVAMWRNLRKKVVAAKKKAPWPPNA